MAHVKYIDKVIQRNREMINNPDVNAYGTLASLYTNGIEYPVVCGHGGSRWLCPECKDKILLMQENPNIKSSAIIYLMLEIESMKEILKPDASSCSCITGRSGNFETSLRLAEFEKAVEVLKQHEINKRSDHDGQKDSNNAGEV